MSRIPDFRDKTLGGPVEDGGPPEARAGSWATPEGIEVAPVYTRADLGGVDDGVVPDGQVGRAGEEVEDLLRGPVDEGALLDDGHVVLLPLR